MLLSKQTLQSMKSKCERKIRKQMDKEVKAYEVGFLFEKLDSHCYELKRIN